MPKKETLQKQDVPANLQFFSIAEVALIMDVSVRLVRQWVEAGLLPVFHIGPGNRLMRVRRQDLEQFIETHVRTRQVESAVNREATVRDDAA